MSENEDELILEKLKEKLDLVNEELSDLETEIAFKFKAGQLHISPAEMELELDAVRRDREDLLNQKKSLENDIAKRIDNSD